MRLVFGLQAKMPKFIIEEGMNSSSSILQSIHGCCRCTNMSFAASAPKDKVQSSYKCSKLTFEKVVDQQRRAARKSFSRTSTAVETRKGVRSCQEILSEKSDTPWMTRATNSCYRDLDALHVIDFYGSKPSTSMWQQTGCNNPEHKFATQPPDSVKASR